jgi:hypothetical protein
MLLTYFDEVKPQEHGQPYYWLGGLMIAPEMLPTLEGQQTDIAWDHKYKRWPPKSV